MGFSDFVGRCARIVRQGQRVARRHAPIVFLLLWSLPAGSSGADLRVDTDVSKVDDIYHVSAGTSIREPVSLIWEVLTDYNDLDTFVPGLTQSESLGSDKEGNILLEQTSSSGFLFFRKNVRVLLEVKEEPMNRISFRQKEGDFAVYEGYWDLQQHDEETRLELSIRVRSGFFAPRFLLRGELEVMARDTLRALALEIHRRADANDS
jgi:ribosome-associated toxin RatA of RatAB toxin-antitoxin module